MAWAGNSGESSDSSVSRWPCFHFFLEGRFVRGALSTESLSRFAMRSFLVLALFVSDWHDLESSTGEIRPVKCCFCDLVVTGIVDA